MSYEVLKDMSPADARGASLSLLATVGPFTTAPANAGPLARAAVVAIPELVAVARRATADLLASAVRRDVARAERTKEVEGAILCEKRLDRRVGSLSLRLQVLVSEEVAGADELHGYLLPQGSDPLTDLTGRPQRGAYDEWRGRFGARPAQGSEADVEIAPKLDEIAAMITELGATIDHKDEVSRLADVAIAALGASRERWARAMADLREGVEVVARSVPGAADAWWTPVREWQRAQAARAARGEPERDDDLPSEAGDEAAALAAQAEGALA